MKRNGINVLYQRFHHPARIFSTSVHALAKNCAELHKSDNKTSGAFTINPDDEQAFAVFCDQNTEGGGWTVFQKRLDGSVDFYRNWTDYKQGFGNLSGEFWLGLDKIYRLTSQTNNTLRVELEDIDGNTAYAEYDTFAVADEAENYRLSVAGYTGNLISQSHILGLSERRIWSSYSNEPGYVPTDSLETWSDTRQIMNYI